MGLRENEVKKLKKERKRLLSEIGLSMKMFKKKMPRVDNKGKNFEVVDEAMLRADWMKRGKKGKKPSLKQQVIWLGYLKEATSELREEFERMQEEADKDQPTKEEKIKEANLPTFKSF